MLSDRGFIFHIYIPWGKVLLLVQSQGHLSKSNINITVSKKGCCEGICVSQTQLVILRFVIFDKVTSK